MSDDQLNAQDINALIDALDVWERDNPSRDVIATIMEQQVLRGFQGAQAEAFKAEMALQRKKADDAIRVRRERSILLKAKLLKLRDSAAATQFLSENGGQHT